MEIKDKALFYDLYYKLALGNTIRQMDWAEWEPLYNAGKEPKDVYGWAVRVKHPDHPYMRYELSRDECAEYARYLIKDKHVPPQYLNISELCPDFGKGAGKPNWLILQGEFMRSQRYVDAKLTQDFSDTDVNHNRMRNSMDRAKYVFGLEAWSTLKANMHEPAWSAVQELLDLYPTSIIEFACYAKPVGVLGWNTIIWEVRNY